MSSNETKMQIDLKTQLENIVSLENQDKDKSKKIEAYLSEEHSLGIQILENAVMRKKELIEERNKLNQKELEKNKELLIAILAAYQEINLISSQVKSLVKRQSLIHSKLTNLKKLLQDGANPNFVEASFFNSECAKYLKIFLSLDFIPIDLEVGVTPLILAVALKCEAIVQLLLENGANVNQSNAALQTPLMYACSLGENSIVQLILKYNAEVQHFCSDNKGLSDCCDNITTAFHLACLNCSFETVQLMFPKYQASNFLKYNVYSPLVSTIQFLSKIRNSIQLNKKNGKREPEPREKVLESIIELLMIQHKNLAEDFFFFGLNKKDASFEKFVKVLPHLLEELYLATLSKFSFDFKLGQKATQDNSNLNHCMRDLSLQLFPNLQLERPNETIKVSDLRNFQKKLPYVELSRSLKMFSRDLLIIIMEYYATTITLEYQEKVKLQHYSNFDKVLCFNANANATATNFQNELDTMSNELDSIRL